MTSLPITAWAAEPALTSDKEDYKPNETVIFTGTGFDSGGAYDVPVRRPNGSIVKGDGSFAPGWDSVTAGGDGNFTYNYKLNGVVGIYEARVYPVTWNGDWTEVPIVSHRFTDQPNPVYGPFVIEDAVTGDNTPIPVDNPGAICADNVSDRCFVADPNSPGNDVDVYTNDIYERPTSQGSSGKIYWPALDIVDANIGDDEPNNNVNPPHPGYLYFRINLYGGQPPDHNDATKALPHSYSFEMDIDGTTDPDCLPPNDPAESDCDRQGDLLFRVQNPSQNSLNSTTPAFGTNGVIAFRDLDNTVGTPNNLLPDAPTSTDDGYENKIFDQGTNAFGSTGGGSDAVVARVAKDDSSGGVPDSERVLNDFDSVEIAVKKTFLQQVGGPTNIQPQNIRFRVYAAKGSIGEGTFYFHDEYTRQQQGSPHPWLTETGAPATCPNVLDRPPGITLAQQAALNSGTNVDTNINNPCWPQGNIYEFDNAGVIFGREVLEMIKEVDTEPDGDYNDNEPPVQVNDTVKYRITISNSGNADGSVPSVIDDFDETHIDPVEASFDPSTNASIVDIDPGAGTNLAIKWDNGPYTVPQGSSIEFKYDAVVIGTFSGTPPAGPCDEAAGQFRVDNTATAGTLSSQATICVEAPGKIITRKVTDPDPDPTEPDQGFDFNASWDAGPAPDFQLSNGEQNDSGPLTPGAGNTYTVSETAPTGWTNTQATCDKGETPDDIQLEPGETVTCTFTNTRNAELQVHKTSVGGDSTFDYTGSGTNVPANFDIETTGGTGSEPAFAFNGTQLGIKQVTETAEPGFTLTNISCTGTGLSYTVGVAGNDASFNNATYTQGDNSVKVDISAGDVVDCNFTNTKNAELQIHKSTVGGDGTFDYTGSGTNVPGTFDIETTGGSGSEPAFPFSGVQLGLKQITEGAETGFTLTDITCTGTGLSYTVGVAGNDATFNDNVYTQGDNSVKVDISAGDDVDCTFTNTRGAELEIHKTSIGGDETFDYAGSGTNVPANFDILTAGGSGDEPPFAFNGTQLGIKQITELTEAGYTLTNISCSGTGLSYTVGVAGDDATFNNSTFTNGDNSVKVDISAGDVVDCTFTNTKNAELQIHKTSIGGDETFDYTGSGTNVPGTFDITTVGGSGDEPAFGFTGLQLGLKQVTESAETGYTLTNITCSGTGLSYTVGVAGDDASFNNATYTQGDNSVKVDISAGDVVDCTFTNTKNAELQIHKTTVGGDGTFDYVGSGVGTPANFDIATTGGTGDEPPFAYNGTQLGIKQITETTEPGFTLTGITCEGTGLSYTVGVAGDLTSFNDSTFTQGDNAVRVDISAGDVVDCTFTNTKNAELQIHKLTEGGDGTFDFTGSGTNVPGTFDIETTGGTGDEPPFLFDGTQLGIKQITETTEPGFTLTDITCTGTGLSYTVGVAGNDASFNDATYTPGDNSVKVNISAGDVVDCDFSNTRNAQLEIHKATVGGDGTFDYVGSGTDVPANFEITTVGGTGNEPAFVFDGTELGAKRITETAETGFTLTNITCSGTGVDYVVGVAGDAGSFTDSTFTPGDNTVEVEISAGDDVDCTFTNTKNAELQIHKTSIGGDSTFDYSGSGANVPGTFDIETTAGSGDEPPFAFNGLQLGLKQVTETAEPGFTLTNITCSGTGVSYTVGVAGNDASFNDNVYTQGDNSVKVDISAGDVVDCTFTNTKNAELQIHKSTVGGDGTFDYAGSGTNVPGNFDIETTGGAGDEPAFPFSGTQLGIKQITELAETGFTITNITCEGTGLSYTVGVAGNDASFNNNVYTQGDNSVKVDISAGDVVDCTFTNTRNAELQIHKSTVGGDGTFDYTGSGTNVPGTFDIETTAGSGSEPAFAFSGIQLGIKQITELAETGFTLTNIVCTGTGLSYTVGVAGNDASFNNNVYTQGDNSVKVDISAGDVADCTFTNTRNAELQIHKSTVGGDGTFDYTGTGTNVPGTFDITTVGGSGDEPAFPFSGTQLGEKQVTESVEAGFTLTNITCTGTGLSYTVGVAGNDASFTNSTFTNGDNSVKVDISAGDVVDCTFTNTANAELQVHKSTVGGNGTFDYTGSGTNVPSSFNIETTGGTGSEPAFGFNGLQLGLKQITETAETGFTLTNITCSGTGVSYTVGVAGDDASFTNATFTNGDNSVKVDVSAGDNVDCTFTNTENASLQIHKTSVGGDSTFDYTGSGSNVPGTFDIQTVAGSGSEPTFGFSGIQLGLKQITELTEPGFTLTNIACTGDGLSYTVGIAGNDASFNSSAFTQGDDSVKVDISAGDDVDCTFTNTKNAELQIHKTVDGVNDGTFDYTGSGTNVPANFDITTSGGTGSEPPFGFSGVQLGTKQVTETAEPGYTLTGIICTGTGVDYTVGVAGDDASFTNTTFTPGDNSVKVNISAGDVVDCTFTNAEPNIRLVKDVDTNGDGDFDTNEPAVQVGDPVQYRIRVINDGNGVGEVPSVVDDYDQAHIDPEAIANMDPAADDDDGDVITWNGPFTVPANDEISFIYDAVVIGTFSGAPGGLGCSAEDDEFPVRNVAAAGPHSDDAIVCVVAAPDLDLIKEVNTDGDADFDDNEPAVEVGDPVQYRIRVTNTGDADGEIPSVVDDYDQAHIDPEAIAAMVPPASDDDGDLITWDGPHAVPALDEITFVYDATVVGTFGTVPGTNPCNPDTLFPVTNLAVAGDLDDDALICVDADPDLSLVKEVDTDLDGDFDDNEPAVEVGDTVDYRIRVINAGDAAGSVPSVVDNYDQVHIDPEAISGMDPAATSDDGDKITWNGPHSIPALDEITFEYSATVIGTFSGEPPASSQTNPCNPENSEFPVRNVATAGDDSDDAIICVEARGSVVVNKTEGGEEPTRVFTFSLDGPSGHLEASTDDINGGVLEFPDLIPGEYTLCEINIPAGFDSDLTPSLPVGGMECAPSFDVDSGEENEVVFDVNNIPCPDLTPSSDANADPDPGGSITVSKTMPANGGAATFTYTLTGPSPATDVVDSGQISFDAGQTGPKTLVLTTPAGLIGTFTITQVGPDRFIPQDPIDVEINPDTQPACSGFAEFPIAQAPPEARVLKTETLQNGTKRKAKGKWTFYLIGPDTNLQQPGVQSDIVKTRRTNTTGQGVRRHRILFDGLEPGAYRLCEKFVGGWKSNLGGRNATILSNGDRCIDFSLDFNDSRVFRVNNRCPKRARVPR